MIPLKLSGIDESVILGRPHENASMSDSAELRGGCLVLLSHQNHAARVRLDSPTAVTRYIQIFSATTRILRLRSDLKPKKFEPNKVCMVLQR
jgi:hypothetical protein